MDVDILAASRNRDPLGKARAEGRAEMLAYYSDIAKVCASAGRLQAAIAYVEAGKSVDFVRRALGV